MKIDLSKSTDVAKDILANLVSSEPITELIIPIAAHDTAEVQNAMQQLVVALAVHDRYLFGEVDFTKQTYIFTIKTPNDRERELNKLGSPISAMVNDSNVVIPAPIIKEPVIVKPKVVKKAAVKKPVAKKTTKK